MYKTYITFGQNHNHMVDGLSFDADCVALIETIEDNGREVAFQLFGGEFCCEYPEKYFDFSDLRFYPRGIIRVEMKQKVFNLSDYR